MTVAVALGSNLGDRHAHLDYAVSRLKEIFPSLRVSRYYETEPVGVAGPQPLFLNAVVLGDMPAPGLTAREVLNRLLAIENERGRERPTERAARTLDLDLILFGDDVIDEPELVVPHPRFQERRFVLEPLAELAPEMVDPVTGRTVANLLNLVL